MSCKPKLTPWFPADVKPVRVGVYLVKSPLLLTGGFSYWDGKRWGWICYTRRDAAAEKVYPGASQDKQWRGLAEKPA